MGGRYYVAPLSLAALFGIQFRNGGLTGERIALLPAFSPQAQPDGRDQYQQCGAEGNDNESGHCS